MSEFGMVPLSDKGYQRIQEIEGEACKINRAMANQFFLQTVDKNGEPQIFVKGAGLQWKMDELYGQNNYDFDTDLLSIKNPEGYRQVKRDLGIPDSAMCVIAVTELWLPGKKFPIREYGTVTAANIKGNKHPVELALTRAKNRAMRDATRKGFVGKYEYAGEFDEHGKETYDSSKQVEEQKKKAFQKLHIFIKNNNIPAEEQLAAYNKIANPPRPIGSSTELSFYEIQMALAELLSQRNKKEKSAEVDKTKEKWNGQPIPPPPPVKNPFKDKTPVPEEPIEEAEIVTPEQQEELPFSEPPVDAPDEADMFSEEMDNEMRRGLLDAIHALYERKGMGDTEIKKLFVNISKKKNREIKDENDLTNEELDTLIDHLNKK